MGVKQIGRGVTGILEVTDARVFVVPSRSREDKMHTVVVATPDPAAGHLTDPTLWAQCSCEGYDNHKKCWALLSVLEDLKEGNL